MLSPAQRFLNLFQNNVHAYAEQQTAGHYRCIRRPVTDELLMQHLLGIVTLGMYAVNPEDQTARYLCWDCDDEADEPFIKLTNWLASYNIRPFREARRPGRWGHCWVLLEQPIPAKDAYRILRYGKDLWQIPGEIYPHKAEPVKIGYQVRLPLGRHRKTSANGVWGLFEDCPAKAVDRQLQWLLEQPLTAMQDVDRLLVTIPPVYVITPKKRGFQHTAGELIKKFPADWEWKGVEPELSGPCPACRLEGADRTGCNLSINTAENVLFCHRNNGEHSYGQIMAALEHFTKLNKVPVQ